MTHSDPTPSPPNSEREPRWALIYTAVIATLIVVIAALALFSNAWTPK